MVFQIFQSVHIWGDAGLFKCYKHDCHYFIYEFDFVSCPTGLKMQESEFGVIVNIHLKILIPMSLS